MPLKLENIMEAQAATAPGAARDAFDFLRRFAFPSGSKMFASEGRTLAASANEDLDLTGTALQDTDGTDLAFTKIRAIFIHARSANTNDVAVGGAASNQFVNWVANSSDIVNIPPGGVLLLTAPTTAAFAVTAGTGDLLRVANGGAGTSVTYDIVLIGDTA